MHSRRVLAWYLLLTINISSSPLVEAQLSPSTPTPSVSTSTTVTTGSSSSAASVDVITTETTQTDILTDPITTADAPVSDEPDPVLIANPDAYGPIISNVTISSITPIGAVIAWTTDEIADSQIEYGLADAYGFQTTLNVTLGTAHIQTLTNLQPGTAYHFRVKSKDTAGNVTISEDHVFTTVSAPIVVDTPPIILTQNVVSVTPTGLTVLWTTDVIADSQVEYGLTSSYGSSTTLDVSFGLTHTVTISNLIAGTEYHYRIVTTNTAGQTTSSGDDTFTTESLTVTVEPSSSVSSTVSVPLAVSEIQATALTSSSALLVWTTSTLADSQIEYGLTTSYGSHSTIDTSLGLAHAELLRNLSPETTYHYRVKSRDAAGSLVVSDDQTFRTLAAPQTTLSLASHPTISHVTVSAETTSAATIGWMTDKLADSQVEYGVSDTYGLESTLATSFATAHVVVLSDLEAGTTYHYRIRTTDAGGRLTLSDDHTFTTSAVSVGGSSITLPSIGEIETSALTASSALIRWVVSVPTSAQVEYGLTSSYGSNSTLDASLSLTHETLLTGLTPDTTYHYRVKSIDVSGNHVVSSDEVFTTLELPTDRSAPVLSGISVTNIGTSSATVSWTTDDASDTRIQYGETTAYGVYTDLESTPATSHSETISGLFPDTTYHFTVQSKDSAGNTAISIDHTFHTQVAPYASGAMSTPVVSQITNTSITLSWIVPFDDTAGTEFYDIRTSLSPITQFNFEAATPAREGVEHIVHVNGTNTEHIYMIIELEPGTSYYFGIKSGASRSALAHLKETHAELTASSLSSDAGATSANQSGPSIGRGSSGVSGNGSGVSRQGNASKSGGSRRLPAPRSLHAKAADREVAFVWTSSLNSPFIHTDIVRKLGSFPTSPTDGQTVYEGRDETFTDTSLTNGKKYHYAIYTHNDGVAAHAYSTPVLVSMLPTEGIEEYVIRGKVVETRELHLGMQGADIEALQRMLTKDPSVYPEAKVTGYFGSLTQAAVKRVQQKHGLPQTGIFDVVTRSALSSFSTVQTSKSTPPSSPSLQRDLVEGTRGNDVRTLQSFLKSLGLYPIDVTGYFGSYTRAGVTEFQKKNGLPATGAVSTMTREKMKEISGQ